MFMSLSYVCEYEDWVVFYEKIKKITRWYELHKYESMYTEHRLCGSTSMYEIMNIERKTLVERRIGKVSVIPVGIQSHDIRNKSWGWSLAGTRN
jgi:hypothetical protein